MYVDLRAADDFKCPKRLDEFVRGIRKTAVSFDSFKQVIEHKLAVDEDLRRDPDYADLSEYYYCKYMIAHVLRPTTVVEIGVKAGLSASVLAWGSGALNYYGYDIYTETAKFKPIAERRLEIYSSFSLTVVDSSCLMKLPEADLYHVDGSHTRAGVFNDLCLCYESAPVGAAILVDDVMCGPLVIAGVHDFSVEKRCFPIFFKDLRGEALFMKKRAHPSCLFMLQSTFPQRYVQKDK